MKTTAVPHDLPFLAVVEHHLAELDRSSHQPEVVEGTRRPTVDNSLFGHFEAEHAEMRDVRLTLYGHVSKDRLSR